MASRGVGVLAAVASIGLWAASAQAQGQGGALGLGGLAAGIAGAKTPAAATDGSIVTGRKRPLNANAPERGSATEIEAGQQLTGDFAEAAAIYGKRFPVAVFLVQGQVGKPITATVDSPDVHLSVWISRELTNVWTGPTMAPMPVAGGPKRNTLTLSPQRTGPYYIFVAGHVTNEKGKLVFSRYAEAGKFTLTVTDPDHPTAGPAFAAGGVKPGGLVQTYAQLCATISAANAETCRVLREGLATKIAADAKASAQALSGPLGIKVVEGSGAQVRADVVAVDAGGPAAAAGLQVGDALLYAKGAGGERVFFGDQASLDQWASRQAAGSRHEVAFARGAELMTTTLEIRRTAPAKRAPVKRAAAKRR